MTRTGRPIAPAGSVAAMRLLLLAVVFIAAAGCAKPRPALPHVKWNSTDDARRILAGRARSVRTVSATGLLTLTRPDGESVRLDAALVSAPPDRLRLRAWKLGRAVLDLTLTPDGLWLLSPEDRSLRDKVKSAGVGAGEVARQWSLLSGAFFERGDLDADLLERYLVFQTPPSAVPILHCYVDQRSLVPERYTLSDAQQHTRFTLELDEYRLIGDVPYPHRLRAQSGQGRIVLQFAEVELNTDLAPAAFDPPRRAEKIEP